MIQLEFRVSSFSILFLILSYRCSSVGFLMWVARTAICPLFPVLFSFSLCSGSDSMDYDDSSSSLLLPLVTLSAR